MLPPHELKNKAFSRAMRGYNPVEVDEYIEFLIGKYTELYRENDELERKLKSTVSKLEEIKNDEDSIRSALIDAKRAASRIKSDAEERAEAIIRSAKASCNTILSDFNTKIEEGRDTLAVLKRDTIDLKKELFDRYGEHIRYVDKLTEGIDLSDIPDTDDLRKKAVTSLKNNIADIYAAPSKQTAPSETTPDPVKTADAQDTAPAETPADMSEHTQEFQKADIAPELPILNAAQTTTVFNAVSETADTIEFSPALDDTDTESEAVFDAIPGNTAGETDPDDAALIVNREPLAVKPAKTGLKNSIRELNKRYKEEEVINTPDSDLEDDANYLDFVRTVTGKEATQSTGNDADFDLLFNDAKVKKKK